MTGPLPQQPGPFRRTSETQVTASIATAVADRDGTTDA